MRKNKGPSGLYLYISAGGPLLYDICYFGYVLYKNNTFFYVLCTYFMFCTFTYLYILAIIGATWGVNLFHETNIREVLH